MKKVIALLAVCGFAIAMVSCGKKGGDEAATEGDSAATVVETPAVDTAAAPAADSTTHDSTAVAH